MFSILPAIDITDGLAVRLTKGELSEKENYGKPKDIANEFVRIYSEFAEVSKTQFEKWVHLVDLDAAFRRGDNREVIAEVVEILNEGGIFVELSGGIRDSNSLDYALSLGVARVNVGTAALENPEWTAKVLELNADKVAIGLDVRGEILAARGWVKESGNLWEVAKKLEADGAKRFVITDVLKDGTLEGTNLKLYQEVAAKTDVQITASGGVAKLTDLTEIKQLYSQTQNKVDSVIFGKALYSGAFSLQEALNVCYN